MGTSKMLPVSLRSLKKGDFFVLRSDCTEPSPSSVWVRDDYDRSEKKYLCYIWDDVSRSSLFKGDKSVYVDFSF